jgi:transposase-like protein
VLERERYERTESDDANYRNGSRPRSFSLLGLGRLVCRVPRDRQGVFQTKLLPPACGERPSWKRSSPNCFSPASRRATSSVSV